MRKVKKNSFRFHRSTHFFSSFSLFFSSFIVLFTLFSLALFPLSSTRNSRGNRFQERTRPIRACVTLRPYGRACLSYAHARSHFARAFHRRWRLVWISHETRNDERASFLSDRSRAFPALHSLVENMTHPTPYFPFFFFRSDENEISPCGKIYLRSASSRLHCRLTQNDHSLCSR